MEKTTARFIGDDIFHSVVPARSRRIGDSPLLQVGAWCSILVSIPWLIVGVLNQSFWLIFFQCLPLAGGLLSLLLLRRGQILWTIHVLGATLVAYSISIAMFSVDHSGQSLNGHYLLISVLVAGNLLLTGYHSAHKWPYIILSAIGFWAVEAFSLSVVPLVVLNPWESLAATHTILVACIASLVAVSLTLMKNVRTAEEDLHLANQKQEILLENMLPPAVIARLRSEGRTFADVFDECSILFADIVGFTKLSEENPAESVVMLLNRVFVAFDDLVDRYGVEKIRTMGDAYMVAAGAPRPRRDHAQTLARLALDMKTVVRDFPELDVRIGINSGRVMAGIIGRKRFQYDLWGHTVNMASRMESHGIKDQIQITQRTRDLLGAEFDAQYRGVIDVKGKGPTKTYLLKNLALPNNQTGPRPTGDATPSQST